MPATAILAICALAAGPAVPGSGALATGPGKPTALDCVGDPHALRDTPATVQHETDGELHQYWVLVDREDLWQLESPPHPALTDYRNRVREVVADTGPLAMIRKNREMFPWLEREHPAERTINRLVESGAIGRHRPMSCLESQLLAYQAARFPLFEQPTEIAALVLRRSAGSPQLKIYVLADDDGPPPKPVHALEAMASDLDHGWRLWGTFHNHTLDLESERGLLAIAAPSSSDLQVFRFLHRSFGLEHAFITDGFSTLELTADEFETLAQAVDRAVAAEDEAQP